MYLNLKFSPLPTFHWFFIDLNVNVAVNHNVINYSNWINWKALRGYTVRMLLTVWTLEMISGLFRPADRSFGRHWGGKSPESDFRSQGATVTANFVFFSPPIVQTSLISYLVPTAARLHVYHLIEKMLNSKTLKVIHQVFAFTWQRVSLNLNSQATFKLNFMYSYIIG